MFEEWYFKKLEDDLKKKRTAEAEEEAKVYASEMEKLEKKENAVIEYERWLLEKKEQLLKATRRKQRKDANKEKVGRRIHMIDYYYAYIQFPSTTK